MATFRYSGEPTSGKTTKDIKVPKADGSFEVFAAVEPNVTDIVTTDATSISFLQSNSNFTEQ
jgi:hypothetical protein